MRSPSVTPVLRGEITLPGDKSISHRALMLLGIAKGTAVIRNLSSGQDVLSTLRCMQALGCSIKAMGENTYRITGTSHLNAPDQPLDCGNSGTTIRLLAGILAGAGVSATLTGDDSLKKRPMARIITPLTQMGSRIEALGQNDCAPLKIEPCVGGLVGLDFRLPMASAQVKSAILLAGLFLPPHVPLSVEEPYPSRDHTERMLNALGANVQTEGNLIRLLGRQSDLKAHDIHIPGDISSAAFWLVGGAILPGSAIRIRHVGLNPSRLGLLEVLKQAGAQVTIENREESTGEPCGDLLVEGHSLKGNITIGPELVPSVIDEIPILTILGLFTDGVFTVRGAEELRYKESDRLAAILDILRILGIEFTAYEDGFSFHGNPNWQVPKIDAPFQTHHDHRLVMALEILNLRATFPLNIEGKAWASISYPAFHQTLSQLTGPSTTLPGR